MRWRLTRNPEAGFWNFDPLRCSFSQLTDDICGSMLDEATRCVAFYMKCPYCGNSETDVVETRDTEGATRRRRGCKQCEKRFTTYERVENIDLVVIKKDGRREKFDREKLRRGLVKSTEKRPISNETIGEILNEIEQELRSKDTTEISSRTIGNIVLRKFKKLDKVAYIRFASVYLDFEDLKDFEKIIEKLN